MAIHSVILAGGNGTRLWPVSRASKPKQFLQFCNEGTMLQKSYIRNQFPGEGTSYFVTNVEHVALLNEQLKEINANDFKILIEPESKNTAPALIAAALEISKTDPEGFLIVAPSDNEIADVEEYKSKVLEACEIAKKGLYVVFGISPSRPEIAYGYLKKGNEISNGIYTVARFIEKPTIDKACEYILEKGFFWNSGIFIMPVSRVLKDLAQLEPKMFSLVKKSLEGAQTQGDIIFLAKEPFSEIHGNSIDYSLMEKVDDIAFIEYKSYWNDLGTWQSVWEYQQKDENGNVLSSNSVALDTKNSLVSSQSGKLIATVGIENLSIIETPDVLLVANSSSSHTVKDLVSELRNRKSPEVFNHVVSTRPWGTFETIRKESNFLIKKIVVKPGQKLSLQYHHHRSEHWVVAKGEAEVIVGDTTKILKPNDYVFIPKGEKHRMSNPGKVNLELLEIQFGDILEESDIVRIEDIYGREDK